MNIEEKRKLLFSFLLEHTAEAIPLRDKVLNRMILVALSDTDEKNSLPIADVQTLIKFGTGLKNVLRHSVVRSQLLSLVEVEKVAKIKHKRISTYYITSSGKHEIDAASRSVSELFSPVLKDILSKVDPVCDPDIVASAFRQFVAECFSKHGQRIAQSVTGEITYHELSTSKSFSETFHSVVELLSLPPNIIDSLKSQCISFLRSEEPIYRTLKFKLTQSYYIAQLLGLDSPKFNPIAEDAFNNATFYLDTNILTLYLLHDGPIDAFRELTQIAKYNNIHLKVSQATVEELHRVIISKMENIESIIDKIPEQLAEKTRDEFLKAFLERRKKYPDLSASYFTKELENINKILEQHEIHLVEDTTVSDLIGQINITDLCETIDTIAQRIRGFGKSEDVQKHDAAHYLLISELRKESSNVWFLTRDRTLSFVANALNESDVPFCFQINEFLQCISPFIQSIDEKIDLANLFVGMMLEDISGIPKSNMLDIMELKILGDLHTDVLTTPADDLVEALDYVKRTYLGGRPYHSDRDHTRVALEIKKFLAATSNEREIRLQQALDEERNISIEVLMRNEKLDNKINELKEKIRKTSESERQATRLTWGLGISSLILGIFLSALILILSPSIVELLKQSKTIQLGDIDGFKFVLKSSSVGVLLLFSLPIIVIVRKKYLEIIAFIITLAIVALFGFKIPVIIGNVFSIISSILPILLMFFFLIRIVRK